DIGGDKPLPFLPQAKEANPFLGERGLSHDDLVLILISGGGSAVMALPAEGITLADKQITNRLLLDSGLEIRTINAVRRRLSAIKGGKLAAAARPARVVTLGISDVPGDDPTAIASGPSLPAPDAHIDLADVVRLLGPALPRNVIARLMKPGESVAIDESDFRLIVTPRMTLDAAAQRARDLGLEPVVLGDSIEGESAAVGAEMAATARKMIDRPTILLSGGETTVTLAGATSGRGGPNTEFALSLVNALDGYPGIWALSADTDGQDGASSAAGAFAAPDTIARARAAGLDPAASLAAHDSGTLFAALGDLLETGPTRTNVNDFRAILIIPEARVI
ncbi:MAG TPA: DUF4147 domain-containing protein, partial [Sphingomonas sp.]|nr:DUF4147 domain-containing protein [Sphingomonas sp.]